MPERFRVITFHRGGSPHADVYDIIHLDAQERHVRRKLLTCGRGAEILVDFATPVMLNHGDALVLEDGRIVEVVAAREDLMEVCGRTPEHLLKLVWHVGNRHLEAQIETDRILLRRDAVIAHLLEHQGASIRNVVETFTPEQGAYHSPGNSHEH